MQIDIRKLTSSSHTLGWVRNRETDRVQVFPWDANRFLAKGNMGGKKGGGKEQCKNDAQYTQWFLNTHHAAPRSHGNR